MERRRLVEVAAANITHPFPMHQAGTITEILLRSENTYKDVIDSETTDEKVKQNPSLFFFSL
jgi:hypothetical protein